MRCTFASSTARPADGAAAIRARNLFRFFFRCWRRWVSVGRWLALMMGFLGSSLSASERRLPFKNAHSVYRDSGGRTDATRPPHDLIKQPASATHYGVALANGQLPAATLAGLQNTVLEWAGWSAAVAARQGAELYSGDPSLFTTVPSTNDDTAKQFLDKWEGSRAAVTSSTW